MYDGFIPVDRDNTGRLLLSFQIGVGVVFLVLAVCFWNFQVGQHARFSEMAENNHQRTLALRAPRGVVFDRDLRVLVENRYSLNISLVRERVENLDEALRLLARVTSINLDAIHRVIDENPDVPEYRPLVIIRDASLAQVAAVTARRLELPGVVVEQVPTRYYPSATLASHSFGHVGEVTEVQLRDAADGRLRSGSIVGQSGVEQEYNVVGSVFGSKGSKSTRRAAAAGALVGGASGSARRSQAQSQATQSVASQSAAQQANIEQQMSNFKNAFGACLEAKDYVARS